MTALNTSVTPTPNADAAAPCTLDELLATYWDCAFKEGQEGRTHDTPDGLAQNTLTALKALLSPPPLPPTKPLVSVRRDWLEMFSALMREASGVLQDPSKARGPLMDELDGSTSMIRDLLATRQPRAGEGDVPAPTLTFKAYVSAMVESHRVTYWTVLESSARPENPSIFDGTGKITPFMSEILENAEQEAATWAEFLGTTAEPFERPDWLDAKLLELKERKLSIAARLEETGH